MATLIWYTSSKESVMSEIIPEQYMCYRAKEALIIDGHLTDPSWKRAPWTPLFVDIEGDKKPLPRFATRVMMLWDYVQFSAITVGEGEDQFSEIPAARPAPEVP
jgi:hypothetical protein